MQHDKIRNVRAAIGRAQSALKELDEALAAMEPPAADPAVASELTEFLEKVPDDERQRITSILPQLVDSDSTNKPQPPPTRRRPRRRQS